MATEGDPNDIRAVERILLRLDDTFLASDKECNVRLDISPLGSWILKIRTNGVIYNNCELIFSSVEIDAVISFTSLSCFWSIFNGGEALEDAVAKGFVSRTGDENAIELFRRKLVRTGDMHALLVSPSRSANRTPNGDSIQPLKAGWLLKKRDLFGGLSNHGWRCRFFVVYFGRVEYYIDQHDLHPRAIVALFGADISQPKKVSINGVSDHWSIIVEPPKNKKNEKTFRLASELTGEDGLVEATTWAQVFEVASRAQYDVTAAGAVSKSFFSTSSGGSSKASGKKRETGRLDDYADSASALSTEEGSDYSTVSPTVALILRISRTLSNLPSHVAALSAIALLVAGFVARGLMGFAIALVMLVCMVVVILNGDRHLQLMSQQQLVLQEQQTQLMVNTGRAPSAAAAASRVKSPTHSAASAAAASRTRQFSSDSNTEFEQATTDSSRSRSSTFQDHGPSR